MSRSRRGAAAVLVVGVVAALTPTARAQPDEPVRFADPAISESSGLVVADDLWATVNDSGGLARVFAVDPTSGETVGTTRWEAEPRDVEALAPAGSGHVWVGDIGDNRAVRDSIALTRVPVAAAQIEVTPQRFDLRYPDGARDAEALLHDPTQPPERGLFVVSKGVFGGAVYRVPPLEGERRVMTKVAEVGGLVTDGVVLASGKHAVLRTYTEARVYTFPGFELVSRFDLPEQEQGEGVGVTADGGHLVLTSEGVNAEVLTVPIPAEAQRAIADTLLRTSSSPEPSQSATAAAEDPQGTPGGFRRDPWPWLIGTAAFVGALVVLLLSLRPR